MAAPIGNKNAVTGMAFKDALRYELAALGRQLKKANPDEKDVALSVGLRAVAKPLVEAAAVDKEINAVKEIADRIDGKAQQGVTLDGELEQVHSGMVRFVSKAD